MYSFTTQVGGSEKRIMELTVLYICMVCMQVKQKLQTAQVLLQCKRDELRRLWLESVEHSHVLHLLEQIEGLNSVPHKLDNNISLAR